MKIEPKFKQGFEYIIESSASLVKMKVLEVTKVCYNIQWETGVKIWETIENFDKDWIMIEELPVCIPNFKELEK
jgi:hypothetical protein